MMDERLEALIKSQWSNIFFFLHTQHILASLPEGIVFTYAKIILGIPLAFHMIKVLW